MGVVNLGKAFNLLKQLTDPAAENTAIVDTPPQKPVFSPTVRKKAPTYTSAESVGLPSSLIAGYAKDLYEDKSVGIQGLLIMRQGKIIFECGYDNWDPHIWKNTFSQCKSICALAIGILCDMGKLSLETSVTEIFDAEIPPLLKRKFKPLTVEKLLTMSSQIAFNEAESIASSDWVKAFFSSASFARIGSGFQYNSLNTYILSAIIKTISGKGLSEFLDEHLFGPMDITNYYWERCPSGIEKGGWGLYITPYDMAKLGQLLLNGGKWGSDQLISEAFVKKAISAQNYPPENIGDYDYGYQIWTGRNTDSFLFNGMLGQNMICYPQSGLIIVSNAGNTDTFQQNNFFRITNKYFAKNFERRLQSNIFGNLKLKKLRKKLSAYHPGRHRHLSERIFHKQNNRKYAERISGVYSVNDPNAVSVGLTPILMQVIQNTYSKGTEEYRFSLQKDILVLDYIEKDAVHHINIGFDTPCINDIEPCGEKCRVSCTGEFRFNEDDLLVLKVNIKFLEFPYTRQIKFIFDGDRVKAEYSETPGKDLLYGLDLGDMMKNIPPWLSDLATPGAENIITKLTAAFEPTLKGGKLPRP